MKALVITLDKKHVILRGAERCTKGNMMKLLMAAGTEDFSPERMETLESAVLIYKDTRENEVFHWKFFRYNKGDEAVRELYARCMETSLRAGGTNFVEVEVKDWREFI